MSVRPRLAVAGVLAAGGFAAGGYFLWPSGRDVAACPPPVHATVPAVAKTALAAYANLIEYYVGRSGGKVTNQSWFDPVTGRSRQVSFLQGKTTEEVALVRRGSFDDTFWVSYRNRTWSDTRVPMQSLSAGSNTDAIAQGYRDRVADGVASIVGRQVVDGHRTIHLREIRSAPNLPQEQIDTWVDPVTFLPVRSLYGGRGGASTTDMAWLPRTRANIAKTKLVVPAGFRRVDIQLPQNQGIGTAVTQQLAAGGNCSQS